MSTSITTLKPAIALGLILGLVAVVPTAATAHVQVNPTIAAPNDAVRFTVLVPGEKPGERTKKVELAVPGGVLPYAFEDPPGWKRKVIDASNGAVGRIVWTGDLAPDDFVEFAFLASTPPKPGVLTWKALQYYSGGDVVRWIGAPNSPEPAPVTHVVAGAPVQNAGGEGGSAKSAAAGAHSGSPAKADWLARALAIAALLVALVLAAAKFLGRRGAE